MEGKQAIKFDKYNSQAMKGIAIVIMLFHHMYLSQDRFEGLNVVFTPFSADRIMYLCRTFKICVPIYAFISVQSRSSEKFRQTKKIQHHCANTFGNISVSEISGHGIAVIKL